MNNFRIPHISMIYMFLNENKKLFIYNFVLKSIPCHNLNAKNSGYHLSVTITSVTPMVDAMRAICHEGAVMVMIIWFMILW
jgi:hypothetical protein